MERQCVFWIPTIYHQDINPLNDISPVEDEDISDKVGKPCKLTLKLVKEDFHVKLSYGEGEEKESYEFILIKEENHRNGFFSYKYDVSDEWFDSIRIALTNPIYHYAKGFYHKHEYHSPDCDSILDAYVPEETKEIKLDCPDNTPLIFYLKQYEKRFRDFAEQLDYDAKELLEEAKNPENTAILINDKYEVFNQRCMGALGEVTYYHSLFYSKYNYSYKINSQGINVYECSSEPHCPCKEDLQDLYKSALNTENAISHIRLIAKRIESVYRNKQTNATLVNIRTNSLLLDNLNETSSENKSILNKIESLTTNSLELQRAVHRSLEQSDKLSKTGVGLGVLGALLGAVSIILAFWLSSPDYTAPINKTIKNTEKINDKIDSIKEALSNKPLFIIDTILNTQKTPDKKQIVNQAK